MPIIPELELLQPVDEELLSWPIFELSDVNVTYEDDIGQQASLLGAPWRTRAITGRLQALRPDQRRRLRAEPPRRAPLLQLSCTTCAYRLDDDGELILRAAGKAGLYILRPCEDYQPFWDDMTDMVQLLKSLAELHSTKLPRSNRGSHEPLTADDIIAKLERSMSKKPDVRYKASGSLNHFKDFLLECFLTGSHNIEWLSTPVYQLLASKFPQTVNEIKARLSGQWEDNTETWQTLPIRTSTASLARKRNHAMANEEPGLDSETATGGLGEPSTPKADGLHDRRQYAMKGRSALRPSAMRLGSRRSSRLNHDFDDDEDYNSTPEQMLRRERQATRADIASEEVPEEDSSDETTSRSQGSMDPLLEDDAINGHAEVPADNETTTIWPCGVPGCTHLVVASSLPDAQLLLDEHMSLHAYDGDVRVQLVQRLQHASLPVSHLMQRVRIQARTEDLNTR